VISGQKVISGSRNFCCGWSFFLQERYCSNLCSFEIFLSNYFENY